MPRGSSDEDSENEDSSDGEERGVSVAVSVRPAKPADFDPSGEYLAFAYGQSGDVDDPMDLARLPVSSERGVSMKLDGDGRGRVTFGANARKRYNLKDWFDILLPKSGRLDLTGYAKGEGKGETVAGFKLLDRTFPELQEKDEDPWDETDLLGLAVCDRDVSLNGVRVGEGHLRITMTGYERRPAYFHMYCMKADDAPSKSGGDQKGKRHLSTEEGAEVMRRFESAFSEARKRLRRSKDGE